jgi:hypothetical protein
MIATTYVVQRLFAAGMHVQAMIAGLTPETSTAATYLARTCAARAWHRERSEDRPQIRQPDIAEYIVRASPPGG